MEEDGLSARKTRSSPRRGRKRDPHAPSPPLSAYSFFFKEMQSSVKAHNPEAKFGEVSKIVASMWDTLDEEAKATYRGRSEEDELRYKTEMEEYNNGSSGDIREPVLGPEASAVFSGKLALDLGSPEEPPPAVMGHLCVRKGCSNHAVKNSEWEDEYCSNDCVVLHCRNVFEEWTQDRTMQVA
eukprot:TRINITY_DN3564_c0_g1_i2.p1 TRINITY_DN3564_c0_g1~~TRINITY_DN3564_c0_g1_i2.p1  ORF type:complete len:183 (-),score=71.26 TRINITY_DN3564_c0_g1_i2:228-776(-)